MLERVLSKLPSSAPAPRADADHCAPCNGLDAVPRSRRGPDSQSAGAAMKEDGCNPILMPVIVASRSGLPDGFEPLEGGHAWMPEE